MNRLNFLQIDVRTSSSFLRLDQTVRILYFTTKQYFLSILYVLNHPDIAKSLNESCFRPTDGRFLREDFQQVCRSPRRFVGKETITQFSYSLMNFEPQFKAGNATPDPKHECNRIVKRETECHRWNWNVCIINVPSLL